LVLRLRRIRSLRGLVGRLLEVEVRAGLLERVIVVVDPGERLATEVSATGDVADCRIALVDAATGVPRLGVGLVRRLGYTESVYKAPADVLVIVVVLGARQHLTIGLAGRPARLADRAFLVRSHLGDVGGRLGQVVRVG